MITIERGQDVEYVEAVLNVDYYLALYIKKYGFWVYLILFFIIFAETGFVVTPFLPGDSLLFAIGAVAATGSIEIKFVIPLLFFAAFLGNLVNYQIGFYIGPKVFCRENLRYLNKNNLDKTKHFYEKYGAKSYYIFKVSPNF